MKTLRILAFFSLILFAFSSCQKEYSLENGTITLIPGTWEFRDSNTLYRGNMDTGFVETSGTTKTLTLLGTSINGLEDFSLILNTTTGSFATGTYMASNNQVSFEYSKNGVLLYESNQLNGEFIVTISSINATNVTGTFTGFARDSSGAPKTITAGKFTTKYSNGAASGGAVGTLGGSGGACTPIPITGTYTQGVALDTSNKATVTVNVTTPGTYSITTNTVNGVTFSSIGSFTNTGSQTVKLIGTGTPTASGSFTYAVTFGTSTCTFSVTFAAPGPPSAGTLGATAGACTPVTPAGVYTQGVALTSANTITVKANVTTIGSYTISTNTVNGVSFSKTGQFTTTGPQDVVLTGTGTPTASGAQNFLVTYGTSTCSFSITFAAGTTPPTGDYFPTTLNSNWVYYGTYTTGPADSSKTTVTSLTKTFNGNTYVGFRDVSLVPGSTIADTAYYRKTANNYFQLVDYKDVFGFDASQLGDLNFLRDNVPTGGTWTSSNISGSISGIPFSGYIKFTILAQGVGATVGTQNFPDVIKVQYDLYYTAAPTTPVATLEQWFAKGVGLIYGNDTGDEQKVTRYQVF